MTPFEQTLGESRKEKPQEQYILDTQTSKRQEVIATARGSMALVGVFCTNVQSSP